MVKKDKGFTLIELIAVLVILAILALIVTPLVMSIIRKAKISADKRSIDAYGRSIELAISGYLMDNGTFPTSISQLTVEYSGDEVVCSTTQLNPDSSVYLTGCTVGGRSVNYEYGEDKNPQTYDVYSVGDEVTYNDVDYYVIKDSDESEEDVELLKKTPLTVAEVNQFGAGHVNMNVPSSKSYYQTAYDSNGYGGMQYYSSSTCGYNGSSWVYDGCTNAYEQSEIKYVVDAWKTAQAPNATNARLITLDDMMNNFGIEFDTSGTTSWNFTATEDTPTWLMGENYVYWTMTADADNADNVWTVHPRLYASVVSYSVGDNDSTSRVVRPVITLSKTNISS